MEAPLERGGGGPREGPAWNVFQVESTLVVRAVFRPELRAIGTISGRNSAYYYFLLCAHWWACVCETSIFSFDEEDSAIFSSLL